MAAGTGEGLASGDLPAVRGRTGSYPQEATRQVSSVRHSMSAVPDSADGGDVHIVTESSRWTCSQSSMPAGRARVRTAKAVSIPLPAIYVIPENVLVLGSHYRRIKPGS